MAGAIILVGIGAIAIGSAWVLARRVAWSDARPGLAPLSCFGDWPHVPAEAQFGDARMRAGSGNANAADAQSMSLTHRGEGV